MADTCKTCRFHDPSRKECRRRPPTVVTTASYPRRDEYGDPHGAEYFHEPMWPEVAADEWCGEYERLRNKHIDLEKET